MEEKDKRDGKNNIILLTVIAVVTLIIVVVGATFAYLASAITDRNEVNINAYVDASSDFFVITSTGDLNLTANFTNLQEGAGNVVADTNISVTLKTESTTQVTHKYNIYLAVKDNSFTYTSGRCRTQVAGTGTAIVKSGSTETFTTEAACTDLDSNGGKTAYKWGYDLTGGHCFDTTSGNFNDASGDYSTSQALCTTNESNAWFVTETPELLLTVYQKVTVNNQGVCLDYATGQQVNADSSEECELANTTHRWVEYIANSDGTFLQPIKLLDVTTLTKEVYSASGSGYIYNADIAIDTDDATNKGAVQLNASQYEISATKVGDVAGVSTASYYATLTMVNFENINQIANGQKQFTGKLIIAEVAQEAQASGDGE